MQYEGCLDERKLNQEAATHRKDLQCKKIVITDLR